MDNNEDAIQKLLEGSEQRTSARFDTLENRFDLLETKVDSIFRELNLQNELLAPFIRWSHQVENEVIRISVEIAEVKTRLAKLENPNAA